MAIEFAAKSDMGRIRTNNEDNFAIGEDINLFVVADGMGGHNAGEVASKMASELIVNHMRQSVVNTKKPEYVRSLVASIKLANQAIFEASQQYTQNQGMGTTVVTVLALPNRYVVAWIGDSRVYLVRHNLIQQLTTDHSLVQEQIAKGLISADQAEQSEFKNVLTRALGIADTAEVDVLEIPSFADDYLILCSDGLTRFVPDASILETVRKTVAPESICSQLITMANEAGGRDNITVVTIHRKNENVLNKLMKIFSKT